MEDFERLRGDPGLAEMIGHESPSPRAALEFLYAFHQEEKIEEAQQQRLPEQIAYIPEETAPLAGLGRVNRDLVQRCGSVARPAPRHRGSGCDDHREPQATGAAHL